MEKRIKSFDIKHAWISWNGVSLEDIKAEISELEAKGATHLEISTQDEDYEITAIAKRIETDEEFEARIKDEQRIQNWQKEYDLKQYAKLKEKYNL